MGKTLNFKLLIGGNYSANGKLKVIREYRLHLNI